MVNKTINFTVDRETLKMNLNTTIDRKDNVQLCFDFSDDWNDKIKVVGFSRGNIEFDPQMLLYGKTCRVPEEALQGKFFRMFVVGKHKSEMIVTNEITVMVN